MFSMAHSGIAEAVHFHALHAVHALYALHAFYSLILETQSDESYKECSIFLAEVPSRSISEARLIRGCSFGCTGVSGRGSRILR